MRNTLIYFICICFVIFSCKKDEIKPVNCNDFLQDINENNLTSTCPPNLIINLTSEEAYNAKFPVFNPLNPNEIAFIIRENLYDGNWFLKRFNLCSGNIHTLGQSQKAPIDWNYRNWLLYSNDWDNNRIYKLKANRSDSIALVSLGTPNVLKWNREGTKFIIRRNFQNTNFIYNEDGEQFLNLSDMGMEAVDLKGDQLAIGSFPYLKIIDLETMEETELEYNNLYFNFSVHFFKDNYVLWNNAITIAYTHIETKETTIIKEAKPGEFFNHLDISMDEKKLVVAKTEQFVVDSCTVMNDFYFSIMDIDGTNEKRILIPN